MDVAGLAREIARIEGAGETVASDTFVAGLLHDIGKLVLTEGLGERYTDVLAQAHLSRVPDWEVEVEKLTATHGEVGAYLVGIWMLPVEIVDAVAYHHFPRECP